METTNVVIIVTVTILILAVFNYLHKKHVRFNKDDLTIKIKAIFEEHKAETLPKQDFVFALKEKYDCSRKEALYLFGKACELHIVKYEDKQVTMG